jgi:hypothetical protein
MAKLNEMTIVRPYDHKTLGRVGVATLTAEVGKVTLNEVELPASSIEYLLTFALQNLQDAYAGAESAADAIARWGKKLDRLQAGTIGTRDSAGGASAEQKMIRSVVREQVRANATKEKWAAFTALEADAQAEKIDAIFAKQSDDGKAAIMVIVAERLAEAAKRAEQAKALGASMDIDL